MGASDKLGAGIDKLKGKSKEFAGKVSDRDDLVAEGKAEQAKGDLKGATEKVKDAFKDVQ